MKNYYFQKIILCVCDYLNFLGAARLKKSQKLEAEETFKITVPRLLPSGTS